MQSHLAINAAFRLATSPGVASAGAFHFLNLHRSIIKF